MIPSSHVTQDGLTSETGLTIKILLWNWYIINPTPHKLKMLVEVAKVARFTSASNVNWFPIKWGVKIHS